MIVDFGEATRSIEEVRLREDVKFCVIYEIKDKNNFNDGRGNTEI